VVLVETNPLDGLTHSIVEHVTCNRYRLGYLYLRLRLGRGYINLGYS
jgi:hypothetical protein